MLLIRFVFNLLYKLVPFFFLIAVEEYKTIVAKKNEKLAKEYEESKKKNLKEISNEEPLDDSSGFVF